jgi:hypothetical protein
MRSAPMAAALLLAAVSATACAHGVDADDDLRHGNFGTPSGSSRRGAAVSDDDASTSPDATPDASPDASPPAANDAKDAAAEAEGGDATISNPGTWSSGASGSGVSNGQFGAWRGAPATVAGTWNDRDWASSEAQGSLSGEYGAWNGDIDDAMGAFWDGSWADAADGAYDAHWRKAISAMAAARAGKSGTLYIRFAHQMNGTWFAWKVTSSNVADFRTAWGRFAEIVRSGMPSAKIVFGANNGTGSDLGVPEMWPGDEYVDVVGVDISDSWPTIPDEATWTAQYMRTDPGSSPHGLGRWVEFAKAHGKPLAVTGWRIDWDSNDTSPGPQDNPFFIQKMNAFFRANAGAGPGQVLYEIYLNISDAKGQIHPVNANPNASAMYKSLQWGE